MLPVPSGLPGLDESGIPEIRKIKNLVSNENLQHALGALSWIDAAQNYNSRSFESRAKPI